MHWAEGSLHRPHCRGIGQGPALYPSLQAMGRPWAWQAGELGAGLPPPETIVVTFCQSLPFASLLFPIRTLGRLEETYGSQNGQFYFQNNGLDTSRGIFGCHNGRKGYHWRLRARQPAAHVKALHGEEPDHARLGFGTSHLTDVKTSAVITWAFILILFHM